MSPSLHNVTGKNYIRPDYVAPYKPQSVSVIFFSWINLMIKRASENKTPKMHYQMIDELVGTEEINVQAMVHRRRSQKHGANQLLTTICGSSWNVTILWCSS